MCGGGALDTRWLEQLRADVTVTLSNENLASHQATGTQHGWTAATLYDMICI